MHKWQQYRAHGAFAQRRHRPRGETGQLGTQAEKLAAHYWVPNTKGAGKFPAREVGLRFSKDEATPRVDICSGFRGANFVKAAQSMIKTGVLGEICAGFLARRMG
jgi:hypothetical protein